MLPPGDLRRCLVALSDESALLRDLFSFRFSEAPLAGRSFGNLFLLALTRMLGSEREATEAALRLLRIRGRVIPVTWDHAHLCAELADGSRIEQRGGLRGPGAQPGRRASAASSWRRARAPTRRRCAAIREQRFRRARARRSLQLDDPEPAGRGHPRGAAGRARPACLRAEPDDARGETHGYPASRHVAEIARYAGRVPDAVLVHRGAIPARAGALAMRPRRRTRSSSTPPALRAAGGRARPRGRSALGYAAGAPRSRAHRRGAGASCSHARPPRAALIDRLTAMRPRSRRCRTQSRGLPGTPRLAALALCGCVLRASGRASARAAADHGGYAARRRARRLRRERRPHARASIALAPTVAGLRRGLRAGALHVPVDRGDPLRPLSRPRSGSARTSRGSRPTSRRSRARCASTASAPAPSSAATCCATSAGSRATSTIYDDALPRARADARRSRAHGAPTPPTPRSPCSTGCWSRRVRCRASCSGCTTRTPTAPTRRRRSWRSARARSSPMRDGSSVLAEQPRRARHPRLSGARRRARRRLLPRRLPRRGRVHRRARSDACSRASPRAAAAAIRR